MIDALLASKSAYRYIQPHYEWAECITSHRISPQSFIDLMDQYKPTEHCVVTTYHDTDIVYTDMFHCAKKLRSATCQIKYHQEAVALDNLEYVGENTFDLSVTRFAPSLNYNHERQGVQLIKDNSRYTMILEILIPSIVHPSSISVDTIIEQIRTYNIISLSYRFIIKGITTKELYDHISILKALTKPPEPITKDDTTAPDIDKEDTE